MPYAVAFPLGRTPRAPQRGTGVSTRFERGTVLAEATTTNAFVALVDLDGRADHFQIAARTASARVEFRDRLGQLITEVTIPAGTSQHVPLGAERVLVRSAVDGAAALVNVTAYYLGAGWATHGNP